MATLGWLVNTLLLVNLYCNKAVHSSNMPLSCVSYFWGEGYEVTAILQLRKVTYTHIHTHLEPLLTKEWHAKLIDPFHIPLLSKSEQRGGGHFSQQAAK